MIVKPISLFFIICLFFACGNNTTSEIDKKTVRPPASVSIINYTVGNSYPHDTTSFTEGFVIHNGELYESTGATADLPQTRSLFGSVDLTTGKINKKAELDRQKYFGEGIVFLNGKVFQLTYRNKIGFVYDAATFKKLHEFTFPSKEGWGMTTDGKNIIMSDGTNILTYLDPNTLQVVKTIAVSENNYVKEHLNELEYIKGFIYANVWGTNTIVKINPGTGKVVGKMDLSTLDEEAESIYRGSLEMNGIAYDSIADKVYVTGKMWPNIYEIKFNY